MLVCRIILQLPDRPGSLGKITTLLGRLGVDIHQVLVLDRDGDRATDEFVAVVPGAVVYRQMADLLEEISGVRVLGVWPADEPQAAAHPDVERRAVPAVAATPAGYGLGPHRPL